jgi:AraC family transcriptional regulator of adaptative response / DNA-3-methyladenine glycosylase II
MTGELDHTACYDAVRHDDPALDGLFFTAVVTTGIFCRTVCRARTPRPENVRFYATAAAASEAGFRPCLRCRPESAPDLPEQEIDSPIVSRALRLIADGILDEHGTDELARRLHISPRQLRRHFIHELGAPPVAVAQTRRLLFAKKLIDETDISMAQVAFTAGYSSVRRFNNAIQQTYGRTPTALRRVRRRASASPTDALAQIKLTYRAPYDWPAMLGFLRHHALPGVEAVDERGYRRTARLDGVTGVVELQPLPQERAVALRVPHTLARRLLPISERAKRLLDLRADPAAIEARLMSGVDLATCGRRHQGIRAPGAWDGFETAVRAILGEGTDGVGFRLRATQLVAVLGETIPCDDTPGLFRLFPSAERLATADLTVAGLSPEQAACVQALSRAVLDRSLSLDATTDADGGLDHLLALPFMDGTVVRAIAMRVLGAPARCSGQEPCPAWGAYEAMHHWADAHQHFWCDHRSDRLMQPLAAGGRRPEQRMAGDT